MPIAKLRVYVSGHGIDVDLFVVESSYHQSLMAGRICVDVDERGVWIASAEDLLLLKLLAGRPRDLLDVADVLFISGQLDLAYLRHWADVLQVRTELDRALADFHQN